MEKMEWIRGQKLGTGRFGTVSLAIPRSNYSQFPPLMVVKSCIASEFESLKTEKEALSDLGDCPEIIKFFGDQFSSEEGIEFYSLFLEYASKGSLSDHRINSGGIFKESDVKRYTRSILKGLCHIHDKGFTHGDIKPQNILVFENGSVKIADFGLAGRVEENKEMNKDNCRGTPLYMSPEVIGGDYRSPADIWALGCSVVEMISGKPAWDLSPECDISALFYRIWVKKESPEIPANLCSEGRDFVEKCFVRDPNERWTARMLLDHPFVSGFVGKDQQPSVSPRSPFDFMSDCEAYTPSPSQSPGPHPVMCSNLSAFEFWEEKESEGLGLGSGSDLGGWVRACTRLEQVTFDVDVPEWSECDTDGWITVR